MASRKHATRVHARAERSAAGSTLRKVNSVVMKLFGIVMVCAVIYGIFMASERIVKQVNNQRVERVRIEGELKQVNETVIQQVVGAYAGQSFLRIDLDKLKQNLEAVPWIRQVSVQREWPETLIVHITEQQAIARWNSTALLNQYGEVFSPDNVSNLNSLPFLEGPASRESEVMQQYQKFSQVLLPMGLRLTSLSLSPRGAWQMQLDNGVKVNIGKSNVVERLQRFTRMLEGNLFQGFAGIDSVDLRYRNGMAIRRPAETDDTLISAR